MSAKIAVVVPCYKVRLHILRVLEQIGDEVCRIYVVDDHCPEQSGRLVANYARDERIQVLYHAKNSGVGAATLSGYRQAMRDDMDVVVKIDGDDQMDSSFINALIKPLIEDSADYAKGNRLLVKESLSKMPFFRMIGNRLLSFLIKPATGYLHISDPVNGFTAITTSLLKKLPLEKLSPGYFFESSMLILLAEHQARVIDIAMPCRYADEVSGLNVFRATFEFPIKYLKYACTRWLHG